MATNFMAKFGYMPRPMRSFGRAAFENGLQYRHSDSQMFVGNILATFCATMMKIGPVTPEVTSNKCTFLDETAKIGLSHRISQQLGLLFNVGKRRPYPMYADYKTGIIVAVVQRTLLW